MLGCPPPVHFSALEPRAEEHEHVTLSAACDAGLLLTSQTVPNMCWSSHIGPSSFRHSHWVLLGTCAGPCKLCWHSQQLCIHALQVGYPCLSLHGAKDQSDRESTINDFKTGVSQVGQA